MKHSKTIAGIVGALALSASPALALNSNAPDNSGTAHAPATTPATPPSNPGTANKPATPGPNASLPAKAKAYGKYCQGTSKKHVAGTPGTPFSACVTALAKVAHDQAGARTACKSESKKKAAGADRSAFSICVSGAAKLKHDQS
jgi:hypothetical protein